MSKQLLVPGGLNAECFQVSVMQTWGLQGFKALRPEKKRVTQVFKNIPNHSLCDLHAILNEHTSIISIQEPSKRKKNIFVYFCLFLSVDFVNILPKSGGEQTLIELDPPPCLGYGTVVPTYRGTNLIFLFLKFS